MTAAEGLRATIIISSYNYARFLGQAIDSALAQTYPHVEVIVVDDGSTDESPAVIRRYGGRVVPLLKENGGQGSAWNAGFARSTGDVILFLDSDDVLHPDALARVMPHFQDPAVAKVHWPLREIDDSGGDRGRLEPAARLAEGDLKDAVLRAGADGYAWPPTSGNAWSRRFLNRAMPMPEPPYRTCPDFYLAALAPLYGLVRKIDEPLGCWRVHGQNNSWLGTVDRRLAALERLTEQTLLEMARHAQSLGHRVNLDECRQNTWWRWANQTYLAIQDIESVVPAGQTLLLANEDAWDPRGPQIEGRRVLAFTENAGDYNGPPADDAAAIAELERLRQHDGASAIAFAWPAFWWLDYYAGFRAHLDATYRRVLTTPRVVVYDLRAPAPD
jgi:hypothetical protein